MQEARYLREQQYKDASNLNARIRLHELFSANKQGIHAWIFDHFQLPLRSHILELGCGPATLWVKNLERIPDAWDITLSDFSPGMLDDARSNLSESSSRFKFRVLDAQSIPFEDRRFDAVIANFMLYHVLDRAMAFSEIRKVLRPGGRLYAAMLGKAHLRELDQMVDKFADSPVRVSSASKGFTLENGAAQMSPWFPQVTLRRYEDALAITEAEPLIAYILSMSVTPALTPGKLEALTQYVRRELDRDGAIRITKDSGLFEAVKPL